MYVVTNFFLIVDNIELLSYNSIVPKSTKRQNIDNRKQVDFMIKKIGNKWIVFPNITEKDDKHELDKTSIIQEYVRQKAKVKNVAMYYKSNGLIDRIAYKAVCKHLYNYYLSKLTADYIAVLVYPEKSKSVYGICIYNPLDTVINDIISDGLEITLNSSGKYCLRLRLNNKHIQQLAKIGAILKEYQKAEFEKMLFDTTCKCEKRGLQVNSIGECFEYLYADMVKDYSHIKDNTEFFNDADIIDYINGGLKVQCKAQKATVCILDTLEKLTAIDDMKEGE